MERIRKHAMSFALAFASAAIVNAQTPPPGGYNIQLAALPGPIGLTSYNQRMNESGHVLGASYREMIFEHWIHETWYFDGHTTIDIGLTGPAVEPDGVYHSSESYLFNNLNHAAGTTRVYDDAGIIGHHSWFFDGTSTRRIGLSPPDDNHGWYCEPIYMNQSGKVVGELRDGSSIYHSDIIEPWYFDGTTTHRLGLTGENYGSSMLVYWYQRVLSDSGGVIGVTKRYNQSGGQDGWVSNGVTTQVVGLTGAGYENGIYRHTQPFAISNAGDAIGKSSRWGLFGVPNGSDSWVYDGSMSTAINLTGGDYEFDYSGSGMARESEPYRLNEVGQVTGYSWRFTSNGGDLGVDAWFYNGATTTRIGLIGPEYETVTPNGVYRYNKSSFLTDSGIVAGYSLRHPILPVDDAGWEPSNGSDAWISDGTTTRQVGLTGSDYEIVVAGKVVRTSGISAINNAGQAAGSSTRRGIFDPHDNPPDNFDAWFFDGESTRYIGLTGSSFEFDDGEGIVRASYVRALSESGNVVGYNQRYGTAGELLGESAWFYDSDTDVVSPLIFSVRPSDQYSDTSVSAMTESGVVLGSYLLFDGETEIGLRPFWWSVDTGMIDLEDLVVGGINAAGWEHLTGIRGSYAWHPYPVFGDTGVFGALPDGAPMYILGSGILEGQTDSWSTFLLTANVPEPTTLVMLGGIVICAMRRHRSIQL